MMSNAGDRFFRMLWIVGLLVIGFGKIECAAKKPSYLSWFSKSSSKNDAMKEPVSTQAQQKIQPMVSGSGTDAAVMAAQSQGMQLKSKRSKFFEKASDTGSKVQKKVKKAYQQVRGQGLFKDEAVIKKVQKEAQKGKIKPAPLTQKESTPSKIAEGDLRGRIAQLERKRSALEMRLHPTPESQVAIKKYSERIALLEQFLPRKELKEKRAEERELAESQKIVQSGKTPEEQRAIQQEINDKRIDEKLLKNYSVGPDHVPQFTGQSQPFAPQVVQPIARQVPRERKVMLGAHRPVKTQELTHEQALQEQAQVKQKEEELAQAQEKEKLEQEKRERELLQEEQQRAAEKILQQKPELAAQERVQVVHAQLTAQVESNQLFKSPTHADFERAAAEIKFNQAATIRAEEIIAKKDKEEKKLKKLQKTQKIAEVDGVQKALDDIKKLLGEMSPQDKINEYREEMAEARRKKNTEGELAAQVKIQEIVMTMGAASTPYHKESLKLEKEGGNPSDKFLELGTLVTGRSKSDLLAELEQNRQYERVQQEQALLAKERLEQEWYARLTPEGFAGLSPAEKKQIEANIWGNKDGAFAP